MFTVSISGQHLGFSLISAFSGTALTGLSGLISGYKSVDGGSQAALSGFITELAFGQYQANLYDWDVSGKIVTYYFTSASGAIPVEKTVVTTLNVSGQIYPASGVNVNATANVGSGTLFLASGSIFLNTFASGVVGGGSGNLPSAWGGSGAVTVGQNLASGTFATVPIASISGTTVVVPLSTLSGIQPISGTTVSVPISSISGTTVVVPPATISGTTVIVPLSILSGIQPISGTTVTVPISSVSGINSVVPIATISGITVVVPLSTLSGIQPISGTTVTVPLASLSGIQPISGTTVTVPIASISGNFSVVPTSTISGTWPASGANVVIPTATLSGTTVTANVTLWQGVAPNSLVSSGRLDAAFNVHTGVARSGTASTIQLDNTVPTGISGVYDNAIITIVAGTGLGRSRTIVNMGSSGIAFIAPNWDASGVPDTTTVFTITPGSQNFSGQVQPASGAFVNVPIATVSGLNAVVPLSTLSGIQPISGTTVVVPLSSLSGIQPISGTTVTVPLASVSGIQIASGLSVLVYSGQLSGQPITLLSGLSYTASGIWPASGASVNATASVTSGQVWLASGQSVAVNSGQSVLVYSGQLSGQPIAGLSGFIYPASGVNVNATASVTSGQVWLASGQAVSLNSGQNALVYSGQLSGQPIAGLSGFIYHASGINAAVPPATLSGVTVTVPITTISGTTVVVPLSTLSGIQPISGTTVTVPLSTLSGIQPISGTTVTVPISSVSGTTVVVPLSTLSGIQPISGTTVTVPPATLSGVQIASGASVTANVGSGTIYLASGSIFTNTFASGCLTNDIPADIMTYDLSGAPAAPTHSAINAFRKLINKWDTTTNSGFLTVFKENASTQAYTQALTSQSGANPVTGLGDA